MDTFEHIFSSLKEQKQKMAIIIGSGFHQQFISNNDPQFEFLKSWDGLLNLINMTNGNIKSTNNSILDFERVILQQNIINEEKDVAHQIEDQILKRLAEEIKTISLIESNQFNDNLLSIFNNEYISDVLNLNFDLLIEEKYAHSTKEKFWKKPVFEFQKPVKKKHKFNHRFRKINDIRFWHPHGDYTNIKSIVLGLRKYGLQIEKTESYRNSFKKKYKESPHPIIEQNWIEVIMNKPILILGASLTNCEQDILFALINKRRNYNKSSIKDIDSRSYIFHMVDKGKTSSLCEMAIPLFQNAEFEEQWNKLVNIIK